MWANTKSLKNESHGRGVKVMTETTAWIDDGADCAIQLRV